MAIEYFCISAAVSWEVFSECLPRARAKNSARISRGSRTRAGCSPSGIVKSVSTREIQTNGRDAGGRRRRVGLTRRWHENPLGRVWHARATHAENCCRRNRRRFRRVIRIKKNPRKHRKCFNAARRSRDRRARGGRLFPTCGNPRRSAVNNDASPIDLWKAASRTEPTTTAIASRWRVRIGRERKKKRTGFHFYQSLRAVRAKLILFNTALNTFYIHIILFYMFE